MASKQNLSILNINMDSGGTEKVISLLLKELTNDYNVTLVLFHNVIHFPIPKEVKIITLSEKAKNIPFHIKLLNFAKFAFRYKDILKTEKIDISISFLPLPNFINGIMAMRKTNIKTILSERSYPSNNPKNKLSLYISKVFYPILYNRCDRSFSNSVYINDDLKNNFGITIPMEVIYNPIEPPTQHIVAEEIRNTDNAFNIVAVGSLYDKKNHIMIIKALAMERSNYILTILGAGPLRDQLSDEIKASELDAHVFLEGKVKNVNDYLLRSDCFVLSSLAEGFPNALLEAMAIGLPCISTNCLSGPLEMLNDDSSIKIEAGSFYKAKYGILINNDDSLALTNALKFLKNNPKERIKYSKLSLDRSKSYYLKTIYPEYVQFINN